MYNCPICNSDLKLLSYCSECGIENEYDFKCMSDLISFTTCKKCLDSSGRSSGKIPFCPTCRVSCNLRLKSLKVGDYHVDSCDAVFDGVDFYQFATTEVLEKNLKNIEFNYHFFSKTLELFIIDNDSRILVFEKFEFKLETIDQIKRLCNKFYKLIHYV